MNLINILRSILNFYYKIKLKKIEKNNKIETGTGTILTNGFRIDLRNPCEDRKYIYIGDNNLLGCKIVLERDKGFIKIGSRCSIGKGTSLICAENIEIGNDVIISWNVNIYDHNSHSIFWEERKDDISTLQKEYIKGAKYVGKGKYWGNVKSSKIKICDKAWIGFGATILKGVTLGEGCVVAAKSVVVKDVEPYTVVGGNPAKVIKKIEH